MEKYIDERVTIVNSVNDKYTKLLNSTLSKDINNYTLNKMYLINKNLDNVLSDIEELDTELDIKYTKKENKELMDKLNEIENYNNNMKKLYPFMLMLNLLPQENNSIHCNECKKKFFGKDFLRRYRQHFNKKHNN